jgi:hypothetical protein
VSISLLCATCQTHYELTPDASGEVVLAPFMLSLLRTTGATTAVAMCPACSDLIADPAVTTVLTAEG